MNGAERIAAERQRQVDAEGWDTEQDDAHTSGQLLQAAECYQRVALEQVTADDPHRQWELRVVDEIPPPWPTWPWAVQYWKPSPDPLRNLVKAGALIAAEIDRIIRQRTGGGGDTRGPRLNAGSCEDCGRRYGDQYGFPDLVVPHEVWEQIMPERDGSGLLCPSCLCRRAYDAGVTAKAQFTSGPFVGTGSDGIGTEPGP